MKTFRCQYHCRNVSLCRRRGIRCYHPVDQYETRSVPCFKWAFRVCNLCTGISRAPEENINHECQQQQQTAKTSWSHWLKMGLFRFHLWMFKEPDLTREQWLIKKTTFKSQMEAQYFILPLNLLCIFCGFIYLYLVAFLFTPSKRSFNLFEITLLHG